MTRAYFDSMGRRAWYDVDWKRHDRLEKRLIHCKRIDGEITRKCIAVTSTYSTGKLWSILCKYANRIYGENTLLKTCWTLENVDTYARNTARKSQDDWLEWIPYTQYVRKFVLDGICEIDENTKKEV